MKRITYLLVLCFVLALCGCDDKSEPGNNLPGGSVRRSEQNSTVKPTPPETKKTGKLPGGSVRRPQE